jgi:glycerol uptake facilitator-like aquaporin
MQRALSEKLVAEGVGSAILLATVVGSGVMGAKLAGGNVALALLGNTIATGAILVVLILIFGPISGAQFNPAVSLALALRREMPWASVLPYVLCQAAGGVVGVWLAHAMFDLEIFQISTTARYGWGQWIAEATATFGLLITIIGCIRGAVHAIPYAVGLYITAAYWFTASTSFANPAVSIARAFSNTFAGIAPSSVVPFIAAQMAGMIIALLLARVLWPTKARPSA